MGEPVARAARTEPEVVRALREEPGVDSVLGLDAPADGAVSSVQFQAGSLDCTSARPGVRRLGLRRASPAPLSRHGESLAQTSLFFQFSGNPLIFTSIKKEISVWSSDQRDPKVNFKLKATRMRTPAEKTRAETTRVGARTIPLLK